MVMLRRAAMAATILLLSGCGKVSFDSDNRPCRDGQCASGFECRPDTQICVEAIARNCDGSGICWSDVQADDACTTEGAFLPCGPDENCDAGCRTCEEGRWTRCGFTDCEPGTVSDCSTCGHDCALEVLNAEPTCVGSGIGASCDYIQCEAPAVDADFDRSNGCECIPEATEVCDGEDDDCNGAIDDMTAADVALDCEAQFPGTHVLTWACNGGCVVAVCEVGWFDNDLDGTTGCESDCAITNGGVETCDGNDNDCNGTPDDVVDPNADCGGQYPFANDVASWSCGATGCAVASCTGGFVDLNGVPNDGCEVTCTPSGAEVCDGADNDCNGTPDDVPQPALNSECATTWPLAADVSAWACTAGACTITACAGTTYDDDGLVDNGCEYSCITSGTESCDGVDNDCNGTVDDVAQVTLDGECAAVYATAADVAAWACPAGACEVGSCSGGFVDSDGLPANGCELSCTPTGPETCDGLDNDCSGTADDMTQGDLNTECATANPTAVAVAGWSCGTGTCAIGTCLTNQHDADGILGTGCEYFCIASGAESCDGADNDCDNLTDTADPDLDEISELAADCQGQYPGASQVATWDCSGACGILSCNGDWYHYDGLIGNGCEYNCTATGAETCNDSDDDCDGVVDNSTVVSNCACADGGTAAGSETCWNGIDDDCNEAIDDGCACGGGQTFTIANESLRCDSGTSGLTLMHLAVTTDCPNDLVALTVDTVTGSTTVDADLVNAYLYDDADNSGTVTGSDLLLDGPIAMSGGSLTFGGFVFPVAIGTPGNLIVVADAVGPAYFAAQIASTASFALSTTTQGKALGTTPLQGGLHSLAGRVCTGTGGTPSDAGIGTQAPITLQQVTGPGNANWATGAGDEAAWSTGTARSTPEIADCNLETWDDLSLQVSDAGQATQFLHVDTGVPLGMQLCGGLSMRLYASIRRSNQGGRCDESLLQNLNSVVVLPYTGATTVAAAALATTPAGGAAVTGPTTTNCTVSPATDYLDIDLSTLYGAGLNTGTLELRVIPEGSGDLDAADGQILNGIVEGYLRVVP